jgi:hypothetical protein
MITSSLRLPATIHRIIHDCLQILGNIENKEPFEIGCKTKSPEDQDLLYRILKLTLGEIQDIKIECKAEDYIVCVKRLDQEPESLEIEVDELPL